MTAITADISFAAVEKNIIIYFKAIYEIYRLNGEQVGHSQHAHRQLTEHDIQFMYRKVVPINLVIADILRLLTRYRPPHSGLRSLRCSKVAAI
jgi:hypothetical protein